MKVSRVAVLCLCVVLAADSYSLAQGVIAPATNPAGRGGRGARGAAAAARGGAAPAAGGRGATADAAKPEEIQTLVGFNVEMIHKADRQKNGSWISMTKDSRGRLLIGGQRNQPMTRLTIKDGKVDKEEIFELPVTEVMGMLDVNGVLYVSANGPDSNNRNVFGLFRLKDTKGDGSFESVEFLREWPGGTGEHGAHGLILAPDKQHIFAVNGNKVPQPDDLLPTSPTKHYADDRAIPRQEDTFMANEPPPGGSILCMDLDGKNIITYSAGMRNTYDIAFNADGEILGYDSDMEWDWGLPWYRPTRVFHSVSGGDQGYRGGSGKYPTYYEDSLPEVVNIGVGCPTGVVFGYGAKFPAKYQKAFYIMDWTYGRLIAVHLKPQGSSYEATWENFIAPKSLHEQRKVPLNVTDMVIGDDGAMYFTIGGRNTQAALYRVTYTGEESTAMVDARDVEGAEARATRHKLEAFHGHQDPFAVATAWPYLRSEDRHLRYAARVAIEAQPLGEWKNLALSEANPQAAIEALLALARVGGTESSEELMRRLSQFPLTSMNDDLKLQKLRVIEVAISRNGKPTGAAADQLLAELDPLFPSYSMPLNLELGQILLSINAPKAVDRAVAQIGKASVIEEQIGLMMALRHTDTGWTPKTRMDYFAWFNQDRTNARHPDALVRWFEDAGRPYGNGNSFNGFINRARAEALATLSPEENTAAELTAILTAYRPPARGNRGGGARGRGNVPPREFVKEWKMEDIEPSLADVSHGRNFERGQTAFAATQCAVCHSIAGTPANGGVGPDLTSVAARFRRRDILESLVEPSKVLSEQFADTVVRTKSGEPFVGRLIEDTDDRVVMLSNPMEPQRVEILKSNIDSRGTSAVSPMPAGLINVLSKDEILDLIAYLEAGGKADHPDFKN